jgi:hypothetical protein
MKTIFVNPRRRKSRKKKSASKKNPRKIARRTVRKNVHRTKRKASKMVINPRRRKSRKARRRNIAPFVRSLNNPLILRNPGSIRRRRRRNPDGMKLDMKSILDKSLSYGGGSALGVGVNIIALNKIEDKWMRNGARLVVGVLGGGFLKGDLGAAAAGALLAPMWQEIAIALAITDKEALEIKDGTVLEPTTPPPLTASLDMLSADLQDVLDEAAANEVYDMYN